jgi:hypothetical protein
MTPQQRHAMLLGSVHTPLRVIHSVLRFECTLDPHIENFFIPIAVRKPFRGEYLTVFSSTKGIIIRDVRIGPNGQMVAPLPAEMFRPDHRLLDRPGTPMVSACSISLHTARPGEIITLIVGNMHKAKRVFRADLLGGGY